MILQLAVVKPLLHVMEIITLSMTKNEKLFILTSEEAVRRKLPVPRPTIARSQQKGLLSFEDRNLKATARHDQRFRMPNRVGNDESS